MAKYDELKELIILNFRTIKAENRAEFEVLHRTNNEIIKHQKETNGQIQQSKLDIKFINKSNKEINDKQIETDKDIIKIDRILARSHKSVSFFRLIQRRPFYSVLTFLFIIVIITKVANLFTFKQIIDTILTIIKTIIT